MDTDKGTDEGNAMVNQRLGFAVDSWGAIYFRFDI
jgi:hypothetical protein